MKRTSAVVVFISQLWASSLRAQEQHLENSVKSPQGSIAPAYQTQVTFSAFLDTYFGYDFNEPSSRRRHPFLFNHTRHNEADVNLALVQMDVDGGWSRLAFGAMVGSYARENLAAEPDALQHIFEAYAGIALNSRRNLWLDAGVFASHIGFESAISVDNFTLTRSLLAENSPYFESGLRLTYKPNDQWEFAGLVLNGWQRIRPIKGNSLPSFGTRVTYTPSEKITFNWSTFVGTDFPDSERRMRYFNNFYAIMPLAEKLDCIAGVDVGFQERGAGASGYDLWWSPVAIVRYQFNDKWSLALRGEYYQDRAGVIVALPEPTEIFGVSLNLDRQIRDNLWIRIEARHLHNQSPVFDRGGILSRDNTFLIGSLSIRFP